MLQELFNDKWEPDNLNFWLIKYERLPSEGDKLFVVNNGLNGFMQRMNEALRMHSIGVFGVYGEAPELEQIGCVLWRGKEFPVPM